MFQVGVPDPRLASSGPSVKYKVADELEYENLQEQRLVHHLFHILMSLLNFPWLKLSFGSVQCEADVLPVLWRCSRERSAGRSSLGQSKRIARQHVNLLR